jgi:DNA topoisomerase-1
MTKLVIVESPTKARTIRGFLPDGYRVEASMGHVRDLPSSAAEVPAPLKGEKWSRMGVNVEHNFEPLYVIPADKKKIVAGLRKLMKEADELLLATDEDREGESIGWHLTELLQPDYPVRRMVFHEITREAIQKAIVAPREIDMNLVRAQEARRILDRLVGYTVSPLLWKKIAPRLSAGRVQSVTVRLLVDRERERRAFHPAVYRDLKALLNKRPDRPEHRFEAELYSLGGRVLARGRDFDEATGKLSPGKDLLLLERDEAERLIEGLKTGSWQVDDIQDKSTIRTPYPPFTTATLQMEANRKLGLGAGQTMRIAQKLYENGYITYMRTDSVHLSDEAITAARTRIITLYGEEFLNPKPRRYRNTAKGAQEAHEAIRPAGTRMRPTDSLPLSGLERALYDLIWKRTIATQMKPARLHFQTVTIQVNDAIFRANGRTVEFPGFFRAYVRGTDNGEEPPPNQASPLPPLTVGEEVDCRDLECRDHETRPPARYTEATLVKVLKDEGIGRPSTYASIINTIIKRGYVFRQRKELVPTFTAFAVTKLMEEHFTDLVDINFTAGMEEHLDNIARGDKGWLDYLSHFYLGEEGLRDRVKGKETSIDPGSLFALSLEDPPVEVRIGRYGPFISWEENRERLRTGIQPEIPPADLSTELIKQLIKQKSEGPQKLGTDPESGLAVYLKLGPFGPYLQKGENQEDGKKPKRIRVPKGIEMEAVTLELALDLLKLPRTLGDHPESGKAVKVGLGRFGPYVVHDGKFASLKKPHNMLDVTLDQALEILSKSPVRRGRTAKKALRKLGEHPGDGKPVRIMTGRYGPYVNHGRLNASLHKNTDLEALTLEEVVELLEKKAKKKKAKPARKKRKKKRT